MAGLVEEAGPAGIIAVRRALALAVAPVEVLVPVQEMPVAEAPAHPTAIPVEQVQLLASQEAELVLRKKARARVTMKARLFPKSNRQTDFP